MDARTLEALKASIEKWERNAVTETPDAFLVGSINCALCRLFIDDACAGCPVEAQTRLGNCSRTPYDTACHTRRAWRDGRASKEQAHAAAREEVAFLKSLLPEGA